MMNPWRNASLVLGANLVLYYSSTLKPTDMVLFLISAQSGVMVFGTSAVFLEILSKRGVASRQHFRSRLNIK